MDYFSPAISSHAPNDHHYNALNYNDSTTTPKYSHERVIGSAANSENKRENRFQPKENLLKRLPNLRSCERREFSNDADKSGKIKNDSKDRSLSIPKDSKIPRILANYPQNVQEIRQIYKYSSQTPQMQTPNTSTDGDGSGNVTSLTYKRVKNSKRQNTEKKQEDSSELTAHHKYNYNDITESYKCDMSTQTIVKEDKIKSVQDIENHYAPKKLKMETSRVLESQYENTFMRDVEEASYSLQPISSPPSVANAMKALQAKIKTLQGENANLRHEISSLKSEMKSQNPTETKKLELEILELRSKSDSYINQLKNDKEEFKQVIFENKEIIEKLVTKLKNTKTKCKKLAKELTAKDQELSGLKIDYVEISQACKSYQQELEKIGKVEVIKQRLDHEKLAKIQLVKEKNMLQEDYEQKLHSLEPEIKSLRDKVNYLTKINSKVQQAQKVTEDFVQEIVSVNELLATSLKEKKREIKHLSRERGMRRSESCGNFDNFKHNKLSETQNLPENEINLVNQKVNQNFQDTSCDSKEKTKREPRFSTKKNFSFKQRAFSTASANFRRFAFEEGNPNLDFQNNLADYSKSLSLKKPKKHRKKNSIEKDKLKILKIEKDLTCLHKDYKHFCSSLGQKTSNASIRVDERQINSLLSKVEGQTQELMCIHSNY
ncbi:unnamed protein product [Moneuplotes crassus]|uniref:Uncharacterized protein n=1 Tax=Euplotes crassus TaxID=5936 RepID=A0AAD1YBG8_EUPCR|nr:unnamed protein product [Moneuplotes crassus]